MGRCFHLAALCAMLMPSATSFQITPISRTIKSRGCMLKSRIPGAGPSQPTCWILEEKDIPSNIIQQGQQVLLNDTEWLQSLERPVLAYDNATKEVFLAYWGIEGVLNEVRWRFDDFDWRSLLNREDGNSTFCCDDNLLQELTQRTEARTENQALLSSLRGDKQKSPAKKSDETEQVFGTIPIKTLQDYLEESISTRVDERKTSLEKKKTRFVIGPGSASQNSAEEDKALVISYMTMRNALESASYRWTRKKVNQTQEEKHEPNP